VHTLLGLSSLMLVVLAGALLLRLLHRIRAWPQRRDLQMLVLAAPLVSLGLGIGGLHHFSGRMCWLGAPPWDYTLGVALPLGMGAVASGALGLGVLRLALLYRLLARSSVPADSAAQAAVQALADRLIPRLRAPRVRVRLCPYGRPLALAYGVRRPTLLLSTWMVEQLDRRELGAVLAHELGHVARRDYLMNWLATVLRDGFFYLPTSRAAYRQLRQETELACDDLAVAAANRPLALASALAKVWEQALGVPVGPLPVGAQALLSAGESGQSIEQRIERLLRLPAPAPGAAPAAAAVPQSRALGLGMAISGVAGLLTLQAANVAVLLAPMGCGPGSALWALWKLL
jgi:Zn-dependent protease with chaperone function